MSLSNPDLYALALELLAGEKDVNKVLADLFEEAGDSGIAQWARSSKGKRRKRLDFVLGILPYRVGLLLACDFIEHCCRGEGAGVPKRTLSALRSWCREEKTNADLEDIAAAVEIWWNEAAKHEERRRFQRHNPLFDSLRRRSAIADRHVESACAKALFDTLGYALKASQLETQGDYREAKKRISDVQLHVRRVAKHGQMRNNWYNQLQILDRNEVTWQLQHTSDLLESLLDGELQ